MNVDMRAVKTKAEELDCDIVKIQRALKRVASVKCRLRATPNKPSFNEEMTRVLQEEQLLKMVKDYVVGPRKNVNTLTQDEINNMSMDEIVKAINAIRSKKTHTRWLTTVEGDNDEFRAACRIEAMLLERKKTLSEKDSEKLSKAQILKLLSVLEVCDDTTAEDCIARLKEMVKEHN